MDNKSRDNDPVVYMPGERPREPRGLRWALRLLHVPGMGALGARAVLRYLPRCEQVSMEPGFRVLYGNVTARRVSFCDTFLHDYAEISIGEGTGFSYQCMVLTATHDLEGDFRTIIARPVVIGCNVWITSRVTILGGAVIGDGAVIGCGSVVSGEIPPGVFAAGVPARPIKRLNRPSAAAGKTGSTKNIFLPQRR